MNRETFVKRDSLATKFVKSFFFYYYYYYYFFFIRGEF